MTELDEQLRTQADGGKIAGKFEPYRVILDYEALQDGFLDRIEDLNVPFHEIDAAGGFTPGNVQKLLSKSRERWARTLGLESLGKMLKGTGMALVLVVDDEGFAPIKEQLAKRRRRPSIVGQTRPPWLFTRKKAREMRAKWWCALTPAQQKKHQRKAQRGQASARRRKRVHCCGPATG